MDRYPSCNCFDQYKARKKWPKLKFHSERQDIECDGWKRLLDLIETAAEDGREEFAPRSEMSHEEWIQIVTLPATISKLKSVKTLTLYGSHLVRIPQEIGEMTSLMYFDPYTSSRLHWFPYEITRCKNLWGSRVSTRALYGNYKFRPPFPKLQPNLSSTNDLNLDSLQPEIWGSETIKTCSVCDQSLEKYGLYQAWLSLAVAKEPLATDVLPLLVNACSEECIRKLPKPADDYVQKLHKGGSNIDQPLSKHERLLR